MLAISKSILSIQATQNQPKDDIGEEMAQLRTEIGLLLKHLNGSAEKLNAMNYLVDEYIYEKDLNLVNNQTVDFWTNAQASNQDNWRKGQGNKGCNYSNYNWVGNYNRDEDNNRDDRYYRNEYNSRNDNIDPYVPPGIEREDRIWIALRIWCLRWWKSLTQLMIMWKEVYWFINHWAKGRVICNID